MGGAGLPGGSPRIERYSCKQGAHVGTGCVRDPNGTHHNETSCLQHCKACKSSESSTSPCGEHGVCSANPSTWKGVEADGGFAFRCTCHTGWVGWRCDQPAQPPRQAPHTLSVFGVELTDGDAAAGAFAVLTLGAAGCGGLAMWKRRRNHQTHGPSDSESPLLQPFAASTTASSLAT